MSIRSVHPLDPRFCSTLDWQQSPQGIEKELIELLEQSQALRPFLLKQFGVVPEPVLNYCNKARALSARLRKSYR